MDIYNNEHEKILKCFWLKTPPKEKKNYTLKIKNIQYFISPIDKYPLEKSILKIKITFKIKKQCPVKLCLVCIFVCAVGRER